MLKAREVVRRLKEYHPPLHNRIGLRLDFNENTIGCSPRVLERLRKLDSETIAKYPEREAIEKQVASFLGLDGDEVLLTNGVDEAIHLLCETYLEPEDEALIVVPTFSLYEIYAAATGARVITVPADNDFLFPRSALLRGLTPRTRLIAIANPNNPTGAVAENDVLLEIVQRAPQSAILIDEAYYEFYGETLLQKVRHASNLFVARTFSKAYGMAGMRAGVLAGDREQLRMVRRVSSPYNVNAIALACLPVALADQDYIKDYVRQVRQGRQKLEQQLRSCRITYWPSHANFVLARFGFERAAFVHAMKERGILVRDRSRDPGCNGCVRITVGSHCESERLLAALPEVMEQIGTPRGVSA